MRFPRSLFSISIAFSLVLSLSVAACSEGDNSSDSDSKVVPTSPISATDRLKPIVATPSEIPTELVITDLTAGSGQAAENGDNVLVLYVGVLSSDGKEFDSNYGTAPINVQLGAGTVIAGWDQGLVGVQQGTRRRLDIPAELAYGDRPPAGGAGPVKAGAALTFVVDVVAVIPISDAENEPQITVSSADNIDTVESTDLIVGGGAVPVDGQTVAVQIITYRADTGELLASGWGGPPLTFSFSEEPGVFPGLVAAVEGMRVGGRRQTQVPFMLMFDGLGNEAFGLPAEVDVVIVVDLVAVY